MTARTLLINSLSRIYFQSIHPDELTAHDIDRTCEGTLYGEDRKYYNNMSDRAWKQFTNAVKKESAKLYWYNKQCVENTSNAPPTE